ncbi:transposase family protein [Streptomyces sp. NPDC059161]|uniref:transposase family protein n=1 Tax=Streptomyces sp. NPDC059161 TaxID=3346749 RepID=UPI003679AE68
MGRVLGGRLPLLVPRVADDTRSQLLYATRRRRTFCQCLRKLHCHHLPRLRCSVRAGETPFRYIREAVDVLAALAPSLAEAMKTIREKAFVILDGTLLPIDRIAADRPCYSGRKRHHGVNVQVLTDPFGRLLWASPALPGATHDLTAAREHGIIDALVDADLKCWADKAYQGAARNVRVPFKGRSLKRWQRRHNTTHAKIRCVGEQTMATLKYWRLLRKLRCSTNRITAVVKAILTLHLAAAPG